MRHLLLSLLVAGPVWAAPVPTGPANVPEFSPAFAGQTRAEAVTSTTALAVTEVATGLASPWGIAFLPDGRALVSEKIPGALRIVDAKGVISPPVAGVPPVDAKGQGGMMGVGIPGDGFVYWTYAEPRAATADTPAGNGLAVARGRLVDGAQPRMTEVNVIFRMLPTLASAQHFGGRMVFLPGNLMFVTLGERSILPGRMQAQDLGSHFGKIVRIGRDGAVPKDNPFVGAKSGKPGARPEIWSYGHRNILAAALDGKGRLWELEHGPKGGDELNLVVRAGDHGWPTISYGEEYSGKPIGAAKTQARGMEQPVYYWDPVIAPSGATFVSGKLFPEWRGNLLTGGLASKGLVRLVLKGDRVVGEERLLSDRGERIRDVVEGPDGAIWMVTDAEKGKLLRVTPR